MLSKLVYNFIIEYLKREPFVNKNDLINILSPLELLIKNNKDKDLEKIIDLILEDNIKIYENTRKKYGVPGYTVGINVGNIRVKLYGGNINYLGEEMPGNALFDIASMTKFYTQILAYNLIKEKVFNYHDKIRDLDNRFVNLGDLKVSDILTFGTTFMTNGRISDKKNIDEALDTLYNVNVLSKDKWNYNDIGLMIMKEIMERQTNLSYQELLFKYIIKPYNLEDTHIIVPRNKYHLITGTPNFKDGSVNDMTANAVGGFSGHAGVFSSSDDLIKMINNIRKENIRETYEKGKLNDAIAVMGSNYIAHKDGLKKTFVDVTEPKDSFAIAGSTRVNLASSSDSTYNILFNPSSMSIEEAKERVRIINEGRKEKGLTLINPVREYEFTRNGKLIKKTLIDPRHLFPLEEMENIVINMAHTMLKLRFINYLINCYDKEYNIYIEKDNNKK